MLRPRIVLVAFCTVLLGFALTRTGRSTESVDVRTYAEMARAIAQNGVPYFDNGPADRFLALRSPFNLYSHGHLWGIYGPVYPYFAALPFLFGGLRLASIATCMLLIPLALVTFSLTRRLLERDDGPSDRDEWYATAAAILVVLSTPALGKSVELSAYPLAMFLAVAAVAVTVEAIRARGRRRLALSLGAGALFAAGSATHLLCLPMSLALLGALAFCNGGTERSGPAWLERTVLRSLWPTRETCVSAAAALLTMGVLTLPLAWLNHVRFGSYNPFSYGPVPWFGMESAGASDQTISAHVRAALPCIILASWIVVGWLVGSAVQRRSRRWLIRAFVLAVAAVLLVSSSALRDKSWVYTKVAFAFTVDQSLVEVGWPYRRVAGTFGNLNGFWAVKSPLQCTPLLLIGLLLPSVSARTKQTVLVVLLPCAALFAYLTLRGNLPLFSALGIPYVYIRYTMPGLPMLIATAMLVVRDLDLRLRHWLIAAGVGAILTFVLFQHWTDAPLYRQVLVLALPVGVAIVSAVAVVLHRHGRIRQSIAAALIAITCGVGIGIGAGHDLRAHLDSKRYCDARADAMRHATPARFAMFGYHPVLDPVLAVSMERDVEYADLAEGARDVDHWEHVRPLLDHWFADGRPVYFVANDENHKIPWPDMNAEPVDRDNLIFRITRKSSPAP